MRTNIDIDDDLMREAMRASGTTKRAAVEQGPRMLIRVRGQGAIRQLRGKVKWAGDLKASRVGRTGTDRYAIDVRNSQTLAPLDVGALAPRASDGTSRLSAGSARSVNTFDLMSPPIITIAIGRSEPATLSGQVNQRQSSRERKSHMITSTRVD